MVIMSEQERLFYSPSFPINFILFLTFVVHFFNVSTVIQDYECVCAWKSILCWMNNRWVCLAHQLQFFLFYFTFQFLYHSYMQSRRTWLEQSEMSAERKWMRRERLFFTLPQNIFNQSKQLPPKICKLWIIIVDILCIWFLGRLP